jgi:hypothetical protein
MATSKPTKVTLRVKAFDFISDNHIVWICWHFHKGQFQRDFTQEIRRPRNHCLFLNFPSMAVWDSLVLSPGSCPSSGIVHIHCNPPLEFLGRKSNTYPWFFFFFFWATQLFHFSCFPWNPSISHFFQVEDKRESIFSQGSKQVVYSLTKASFHRPWIWSW